MGFAEALKIVRSSIILILGFAHQAFGAVRVKFVPLVVSRYA